MIDNIKNNICRGGGSAILLRSGRRGLSLVLGSVTEVGGGSGKRQNWNYVTGE